MGGVHLQNGYDGQDHHGLDQDQHRTQAVDLIKKRGTQAGAERGQVQGQSGLYIGQAASLQTVREMLGVTYERASALFESQGRDTEKVVERHGQGDERGVGPDTRSHCGPRGSRSYAGSRRP